MIEINLLPGVKRKRGGKGAGFRLPDTAALAASVKDPWLLAASGSWLVVAALFVTMYMPRRAQVRELEPRLAAVKREESRLQAVLAQKRRTEAERDRLIAQIEVIRDIDRERYIWPHILDAVAKALPPYTWLDDLTTRGVEGEEGAVGFQVTGKSADIQAITRFVRNLEESPFLMGATTISTGVVSEQGRDVYTFVLNARYERPDSTLLTMRPLEATVVEGFRSGTGRRR